MTRIGNAAIAIALVFACEFAGVAEGRATGSPEASSSITIHVYNYAKVDNNTLEEAEKNAAGIFRKVGITIHWVDADLAPKEEASLGEDAFLLSHVQLSILPQEMAERLEVPRNAMGLTPGKGSDRQLIYVFYNRVEAVSQRQIWARKHGQVPLIASRPKILGCAIAHELGHVLLNLEVHSATGIMRGGWDKKDLLDIAYGSLGFTAQQSEVIRAEAARRVSQQDILASARQESAGSAKSRV